MQSFTTWFLQQLPAFFMTPPVSMFTGLAILLFAGGILKQIIHLGR